ncbi:radial spoke head 10 homolog B [Menidia menidia]
MRKFEINNVTAPNHGNQYKEESCGTEKSHEAENRKMTELVRWSENFNLGEVDQTNQRRREDQSKQNEDSCAHEPHALVFLNIERYEGETNEGHFHGDGVAFFEGGHHYKGTFSKGLMEGFGVFTMAIGLKYEGEFVGNTSMGRGTYTWPHGSTYVGEVHNGIRHGTGTYKCAKTSLSYTGQWHRGRWHGQGTAYYNEEGTSWYRGDWVMSSREGRGVRRYPSGNIYSGEWKNNVRHGEGTMRWLKMRQQYVGGWQDGVQHGRGTHVWMLLRADGSQYSQSNRYEGDFFHGQRHGKGTFFYAGGAIYKGEWRNNKKHGQGKFTFKDGRVFEGEFVEDQMMDGSRAPSPLGGFPLSGSDSSILGPDMALSIGCLLERIPENRREVERKQVESVVLQNHTELRSIYSFYSRLGRPHSPDNTFRLARLSFWRLLKDCNVHRLGLTLTQMDRFIGEEADAADVCSPFTPLLLRQLLSSLVIVAYHIYSKDMAFENNLLAACLSKLITDSILPNAKTVKGFLFKHPDFSVEAMKYTTRCWEVYETFCKASAARRDKTMTCRHLLWMFKDLHLLDHMLTTARLLEIITAESGDHSNLSSHLELELTFLEFFEVLVGCSEVKQQQVSDVTEEDRPLLDIPAKKDLSEVETGGLTGQDDKSQHVKTEDHRTPQSTEWEIRSRVKEEQNSEADAKDGKLSLRIQKLHRFFKHVFFPAFDHHQTVTKRVETLIQKTQRHKATSEHP